MRKTTLITGSPRKSGNTNILAEAYIEAAQQNGREVARFDACELNMAGCRAYGACYKKDHACVFEHDFDAIAEAILESDAIVFTLPVYWFSVPGQIKSILDHFYAFMLGGKSLEGKHIVVLGTAGQPVEAGIFKGVTDTFQGSADFLKCTYEEHYFGGMNVPGAIRETEAMELVQELAAK